MCSNPTIMISLSISFAAWKRRAGAFAVVVALASVVLLTFARLGDDPDPAGIGSPEGAGGDPAPQVQNSVTVTRTRTKEPDDSPEGRLVSAARAGREGEVGDLLGKGVSVRAMDLNGDGPLHQAARGDALDVVELLLARGADPGAPDGVGWSPLAYAAFAGSPAVAERLIEAGAPLESASAPVSALNAILSGWLAARVGIPEAPAEREEDRLALVRTLFRHGADPARAGTALVQAVTVLKHEALVATLLEHGVALDGSAGASGRYLLQLRGPIGDRLRAAFPEAALPRTPESGDPRS